MKYKKYYDKTLTFISSQKIKFVTEEEKNEIIEQTSFLKYTPTIAQRIKVINENYTEHPLCICGKELDYSNNKQAFKKHCSIKCACVNRIRTPKEKKKLDFTNAKILPKEEVKNFLLQHLDKFYNGGAKGINILKKNLDYYKSLLHYTTMKKLNAKIYELLYGVEGCKICGKETYFLSLEKGFCELCSKHGTLSGSVIKGKNSIQKAVEKIKSFENYNEFEFIHIPNKINDIIILKHKICENKFNVSLKNGKLGNYVLHCGICQNKTISSQELYLCNWFKKRNIDYIQQYRINNKKLDIYLPNYNLAIEYHGIMFHSYGKSNCSKFNNYEQENSNIHLDKYNLCLSNNIKILQIFENEWLSINKKDIWLSMISSKLNLNETIYARKCYIKTINKIDTNEFINCNHIQGITRLYKFSFGLYYNDELVSIMTIDKPRFNKKYDWEILRFCNKKYINVVGGFSKLLKHFENNYKGSIISYANKRWSHGNLYEKTNFIHLYDSSPNYFYFKNTSQIYSRNEFQKHLLEKKLVNFDPNLTEKQNMINNGYRIIWDCGNKVYVKNI